MEMGRKERTPLQVVPCMHICTKLYSGLPGITNGWFGNLTYFIDLVALCHRSITVERCC